ncbi:MAG TPA: PD-(D/E)XK nuclease family protein, partial [Saprospiraceae bacterium]|nr:PD-(D/E)XK nuclease family protein [Saprospiraceae bacterium]
EKPFGGSYWQQMVFYAILLKNHGPYKNAQVRSSFYFVNPRSENSYNKKEVLPTPEQMELMEKLIVETYGKIKQGIFTPGCGKPECEWCRYVNSGVTIQLLDLEEAEQED